MVLFQSSFDHKYQLLENPRKRCVFVAHSWAIFGLMVLSVSITLISLIVIWDQIKQMQQKTETLDFVLFGPKRDISDLVRVSEYRALAYGLASKEKNDSDDSAFIVNENEYVETFQHVEKKYSLICYYVTPSHSSPKDRLQPSNIDPLLCTHIIVFFASVEDNVINFTDTEVLETIVKMKLKNQNLKLLLSVVAISSSEDPFTAMVSSVSSRQRFVNSSLQFLQQYSLDGIDLDWEFPAWPPSQNAIQKSQFADLLKEMRTAFGDKYLISVAVAAPYPIVNRAYDIPKIAQYADFVNVMCYDYHTFVWYLPYTGPNAPLFAENGDLGYEKTLNANYTINLWISSGMPKNKIMLGVPIYGHSWLLQDPAKHDFGAPANGFGTIGEKGFVSYREVCKFLNSSDVIPVFNGNMRVPYAYRQKEWFSYDNERSILYKANYAMEMGIGGVMVFSLNQDDVDGSACPSREPFLLVNRLKFVLLDDGL